MVNLRKRLQSKPSRKSGSPGKKNVGRARPARRQTSGTKLDQAIRGVDALIEAIARPAIVIGGIAVIAHGYSRNTNDIDVAVVTPWKISVAS